LKLLELVQEEVTVDYWNALPNSIVEAPTVNSFKARIDKHWKGEEVEQYQAQGRWLHDR